MNVLARIAALGLMLTTLVGLYGGWLLFGQIMAGATGASWLGALIIERDMIPGEVTIGHNDLMQIKNATTSAEKSHIKITWSSQGWTVSNVARERRLELTYGDWMDRNGGLKSAGFGDVFARRWWLRKGNVHDITVPATTGSSGRTLIRLRLDLGRDGVLRVEVDRRSFTLRDRAHDGADLAGATRYATCQRRSLLDRAFDGSKAWLKGARARLQDGWLGRALRAVLSDQRGAKVMLRIGGGITCSDDYAVPLLGIVGTEPDMLRIEKRNGRLFVAPGDGDPLTARRMDLGRGRAPERFSDLAWSVRDAAWGQLTHVVAGRTRYAVHIDQVGGKERLKLTPEARLHWIAGVPQGGAPAGGTATRVLRRVVSYDQDGLLYDIVPPAATPVGSKSDLSVFPRSAVSAVFRLDLAVIAVVSAVLAVLVLLSLRMVFRFVTRRIGGRSPPFLEATAVTLPAVASAGACLALVRYVPAMEPGAVNGMLFEVEIEPVGNDLRAAWVLLGWAAATLALGAASCARASTGAVLLPVFWLMTTLLALTGLLFLAQLGFGAASTRWLDFLHRRMEAMTVCALAVTMVVAISSDAWRIAFRPLFLTPPSHGRPRLSTWRRFRGRIEERGSAPASKWWMWLLALFLGERILPIPPIHRLGRVLVYVLSLPIALACRFLVRLMESLLSLIMAILDGLILSVRLAAGQCAKWLAVGDRSASTGRLRATLGKAMTRLARMGPPRERPRRFLTLLYRSLPIMILGLLFLIWLAIGSETGIGSLQPSEAAKFGFVAIVGVVLIHFDRARMLPEAPLRYWYPFVLLLLTSGFIAGMLLVPALKSDMSPILIVATTLLVSALSFQVWLEFRAAALTWFTSRSGRESFRGLFRRPPASVAAPGGSWARRLWRVPIGLRSARGWDRGLRHVWRFLLRHSVQISGFLFVLLALYVVWPRFEQIMTDEQRARTLYEESALDYLRTPVERLVSFFDVKFVPNPVVEYPDLSDQATKSRKVIAVGLCAGDKLGKLLKLASEVKAVRGMFGGTNSGRDDCAVGQRIFEDDEVGRPLAANPAPHMLVPAVQDDFAAAFILGRFGAEFGIALLVVQIATVALLLLGAVCVQSGENGDAGERMVRQYLGFCMMGGGTLLLLHWFISWGNSFGVLPIMGQPMSWISAGESHTLFMALPITCVAVVGMRLAAVRPPGPEERTRFEPEPGLFR